MKNISFTLQLFTKLFRYRNNLYHDIMPNDMTARGALYLLCRYFIVVLSLAAAAVGTRMKFRHTIKVLLARNIILCCFYYTAAPIHYVGVYFYIAVSTSVYTTLNATRAHERFPERY